MEDGGVAASCEPPISVEELEVVVTSDDAATRFSVFSLRNLRSTRLGLYTIFSRSGCGSSISTEALIWTVGVEIFGVFFSAVGCDLGCVWYAVVGVFASPVGDDDTPSIITSSVSVLEALFAVDVSSTESWSSSSTLFTRSLSPLSLPPSFSSSSSSSMMAMDCCWLLLLLLPLLELLNDDNDMTLRWLAIDDECGCFTLNGRVAPIAAAAAADEPRTVVKVLC